MGENFVGHLRDLFFVQPFGDTNDVVDLIVEAELVELPHILHAEHFLPAAGLDIGRKKQRPGGESGQVGTVGSPREAQQQAILERHDTEGRTTAGVGRVWSICEIDENAAGDGVDRRRPPRGEQQQLVLAAIHAAIFLSLLDGDRAALKRSIFAVQLPHPILEGRRHLHERGVLAPDLVVVAVAQGLPDHGSRVGKELAAGLVEHQAHRTLVDRFPLPVAKADELEVNLSAEREIEHHLPAVDQGRKHGVRDLSIDAAKKVVYPDPGLHTMDRAAIPYLDVVVFHDAPFQHGELAVGSEYTAAGL